MPFVKLDCNMLRSTLWFERLQREIFITALLMAEPMCTSKKIPQLKVRSLDETGWNVPASPEIPYGFVAAAGVGIVRHAIISNKEDDIEQGLDALERLGDPEQSSRTHDHEGRRLVRIDGGYLVLNYGKYRERDYTAAERQRRHRAKRKRNAVTSPNNAVTSRLVTHAEADAEADADKKKDRCTSVSFKRKPKDLAEVIAYAKTRAISKEDAEAFFDSMEAGGWTRNGKALKDWEAQLRAYKANGYLASQRKTGKQWEQKKPDPIQSRIDREYEEAQKRKAERREKQSTTN